MRAQQFIKEAPVKPYAREELTVESALAVIKEHCSQSLGMINGNSPLWRGMNNHSEDLLNIWPETGIRKSQNTTNQYTQLLSNSPFMRGFPQRNKSIICSTSMAVARGYGGGYNNLFAIIPYDNVEIGVCPEDDLWDTMVEVDEFNWYGKMSMFNEWLDNHMRLPEQFADMKAALKNPDSVAYKTVSRRFLDAGRTDDPEALIPILFKALQPKRLGFQLLSPSQFVANVPSRKECWVSGPCVAIRNTLWDYMIAGVKRDNNASN
jgi:hypothetical protein